jgi:hypothetical protein
MAREVEWTANIGLGGIPVGFVIVRAPLDAEFAESMRVEFDICLAHDKMCFPD